MTKKEANVGNGFQVSENQLKIFMSALKCLVCAGKAQLLLWRSLLTTAQAAAAKYLQKICIFHANYSELRESVQSEHKEVFGANNLH